MMNNSTIEALKAMRFSAMAAEFERQLGDPAAYSMLGFEERFALMVDAEWNRRQQNRLARCIREVERPFWPALLEMRPAANTSLCDISDSRNCWRN